MYSDPAQFIITLFDTTSKQKKEIEINIISTFKFDSPKRGTRDYDKKILEFCLDEPRTRKEIQQYLEIADRKNFVNTVLIPLIDCELLLKTQLSNNAPNQKYRTNKEKLIYEQ